MIKTVQNRTEAVHGTLRFLFLSHLLYGICVKIFIMNQYISKSYTTTKNTIGRQYTERVIIVIIENSELTSISSFGEINSLSLNVKYVNFSSEVG